MMIPRSQPEIYWRELKNIVGSPQGNFEAIECQFLEKFKYKCAVWFPYARVGIRAFIETLDAPGDEVVLSPYNCAAVSNAIFSSGHLPHYVDTAAGSFNQDLALFNEALQKNSVKTGLLVSAWGIPAETSGMFFEKPVLHDFAMRSLDPSVPPLKNQDAVVYSLNHGKPVTSIRGGMLCGNSETRASLWRQWRNRHLNARNFIWVKDEWEVAKLKLVFQRGIFDLAYFGWKHLPNLARKTQTTPREGAWLPKDWREIPSQGLIDIGIDRLNRIERLRELRQRQIEFYHRELSKLGSDQFALPPANPFLSHYPIRTKKRSSLAAHLADNGVFTSTRMFDTLLTEISWLRGRTKVGEKFPNADNLARTTLQLPLYSNLGLEEQQRIVEHIGKWANGRKG